MAKRKKKRKAKRSRTSRTATRSSGSRRAPRIDLSMEDMLARIPGGKVWLTTRELQHVLNDCHEITVYRLIKDKRIRPYRTNSRGKANIYKRADVERMVKDRFTPKPVG